MDFSPLLIFSISILVTSLTYKYFGASFALDIPDSRKGHIDAIPQIGGLIFGVLYLLTLIFLDIVSSWYLICGLITIFLGVVDDIYHLSWKIKLIIQLFIASIIAYVFWGLFSNVTFYNYSIELSETVLFIIFLVWFIGIYNAINLIDGLDGLAGGFSFILLISIGLSNLEIFSQINIILSIIILSFLIFNQRPAKLFMGDAGSLFLGFHTAVLPLLYYENNTVFETINMTPFILLTSFLIADTTRVFFTRILDGKSPMTADTIHFHHLIFQQSGSYLASIFSIFFVIIFSVIFAVLSFHSFLSSNIMLAHMALLLLFILTPPIETYVPIITKITSPIYLWYKNSNNDSSSFIRTFFVILLFIGIIFSQVFSISFYSIFNIKNLFSMLFLSIVVYIYRKEKLSMYVIQLGFIILFLELNNQLDLSIFTKLFISLFLVSFLIFIIERRRGYNIIDFSTLDILVISLSAGGILLSFIGFSISSWFILAIFSYWFSLRFILLRSFYL